MLVVELSLGRQHKSKPVDCTFNLARCSSLSTRLRLRVTQHHAETVNVQSCTSVPTIANHHNSETVFCGRMPPRFTLVINLLDWWFCDAAPNPHAEAERCFASGEIGSARGRIRFNGNDNGSELVILADVRQWGDADAYPSAHLPFNGATHPSTRPTIHLPIYLTSYLLSSRLRALLLPVPWGLECPSRSIKSCLASRDLVSPIECLSLECPNRSIQSCLASRCLQNWSSQLNIGVWKPRHSIVSGIGNFAGLVFPLECWSLGCPSRSTQSCLAGVWSVQIEALNRVWHPEFCRIGFPN